MNTNETKPGADGKSCSTKCSTKCAKVKCYGLFVIGILAVLATVIQLQPAQFHIERSLVMNTSPAAAFEQVNDLRKWEAWSPFVKMDPEAKAEYAGPGAGMDAALSWDGKKNGKGTMTIIESKPAELVKFRLDFIKPFKGTSFAQFTFAPEEGGTRVTWAMDGENGFIGKAMSLVMNCEKMMGPVFEDGLNSMKNIVEGK